MDMFHFIKDYHNTTTVHPIGLVALTLAVAAVFLVPRRYALIPFIVVACIIAPAQRVVIFGLDFTFLRLLTTVGWIRIIAMGDNRGFKFTLIDKVMIGWVLFTLVISPLRQPSMAILTYNLGVAFDAIGTYFLVRLLVRSRQDIIGLASGAAILSIPIASAMLYERMTGTNVFTILGGVPEHTIQRFGRYRAQAAFAHPIVAGVFWASLLPLILAGIRRRTDSIAMTAIGTIGTVVIVWCCSSSTPVHLIGLIGIASLLFAVRWTLPWLRGGIIVSVVVLHVAMFQPVWHLFARVNFFHGSTGWWRYLVIDTFVNNWYEWILAGTSNSTQWISGGHFADVTNEYVLEGVNGGIVKLALFLALIVLAFRQVGRSIRRLEQTQPATSIRKDSGRLWLPWCVGVGMMVHAAAYFATGYFGQLIFMQFLSLGVAGSLATIVPQMRKVVVVETDAPPEQASAPAPVEAPGPITPPDRRFLPAPAGGPSVNPSPDVAGFGWRPNSGPAGGLFKPI